MKRQSLFPNLCKLIGGSGKTGIPSWVMVDRGQLLAGLPLMYREAKERGITKLQAYALWESIVTDVYSSLSRFSPPDDIKGWFDVDKVTDRDLLYSMADIVNYFLNENIPGFGTQSRKIYKEKEKNYGKVQFGKLEISSLRSEILRFKEKAGKLERVPNLIAGELEEIDSLINSIELKMKRYRLLNKSAQKGILAISKYTEIKTGKLAKAIHQDLKQAKFDLKNSNTNLEKSASNFENALCKKYLNISNSEIFEICINGVFERDSKTRNTYILVDPEPIDFGYDDES